MCCGKMVKLPNERKRTMLTTGDISIDLDKENKEKNNDNNKGDKRESKQR